MFANIFWKYMRGCTIGMFAATLYCHTARDPVMPHCISVELLLTLHKVSFTSCLLLQLLYCLKRLVGKAHPNVYEIVEVIRKSRQQLKCLLHSWKLEHALLEEP